MEDFRHFLEISLENFFFIEKKMEKISPNIFIWIKK